MRESLTWMTRQINRRIFLRRTATATFGLLAGVAVGTPRALAAIPCSPSPDCRSISTSFCRGNQCVCGTSQFFCCSKENRGCHSAGNYCWASGGKKCCDCICNVFSAGGHTYHCICYG
jgi:hypothetical protein